MERAERWHCLVSNTPMYTKERKGLALKATTPIPLVWLATQCSLLLYHRSQSTRTHSTTKYSGKSSSTHSWLPWVGVRAAALLCCWLLSGRGVRARARAVSRRGFHVLKRCQHETASKNFNFCVFRFVSFRPFVWFLVFDNLLYPFGSSGASCVHFLIQKRSRGSSPTCSCPDQRESRYSRSTVSLVVVFESAQERYGTHSTEVMMPQKLIFHHLTTSVLSQLTAALMNERERASSGV